MNLVRLRKDFKEIRETLTKYRGRLVNANNIGDQLEAVRDLEQAMAEVSKRIVRAEGGHITSSIIRRFWDSAREGNWMKLLSEPIDLLWERIETHGSAQLATHFVDIYRQFRNIPDYYNLLVRVFGEVDYKAFELYSPVQN
jgi:ubiquinone biosynthesis protein UbiJ